MVLACPTCDKTNLVRRSGDFYYGDVPNAKRWHCMGCGAEFADPVRRERTSGGDSRHGLAGRLADADPDEVFSP